MTTTGGTIMKWVEIRINLPNNFLEIMTYIMYEIGIDGIIIEDYEVSLGNEKIPKDQSVIKGYLSASCNIDESIKKITDLSNKLIQYDIGMEHNNLQINEVFEKDWAESWKKYYKPVEISENIVIKPTWEKYKGKNKKIVVEIDPGMAFGTGTHETTIMSIKALEKQLKTFNQKDVMDIGCGSGILSIVAEKLGAKRVLGIDIDNVAVNVATENVKINNSEKKVKIIKGDLLNGISKKADIIIANLITDIINNLIPIIPQNLNPGGTVILSGIGKKHSNKIKETLDLNGFKIIEKYEDGEWVTLTCKENN